MKINNENDEKINNAILLRESGKKDQDIFKMFPEVKNEISEIFSIIDTLSKGSIRAVPPKSLLRKVLINVPKQNKTESIIKHAGAESIRRNISENEDHNSNNKGRTCINILTLISNSMNKKTAMGMGLIVLMLALTVGASIALKGKRDKNINDRNIAIENEINDEKNSYDKDIADLDELTNDKSADEIGDSLANIEDDVEASSTTSAAELELFEKELAYEIDSFSSDLDSNTGIENDTSLNSLSTDLGGV